MGSLKMRNAKGDVVERVLAFWYEGNFNQRRKSWFKKDAAFDERIRQLFGDDVEKAASGEYDDLLESPEGALVLMILLDQFSRNLFRDNPKTFANDAKALKLAKAAIAKGLDKQLTTLQRIFFYLPFEHSENLDDQDRAVELCEAMGDADYLKYAILHRDVIKRFGRFPHRNKVLGRSSSKEEMEFLKTFNSF